MSDLAPHQMLASLVSGKYLVWTKIFFPYSSHCYHIGTYLLQTFFENQSPYFTTTKGDIYFSF